MQQVIQPIDGRETMVAEVPAPACRPNQVLVANACSLISAGTERAVVDLARKSLLGKARERPDQVRRVLRKVRQEGVAGTLRQVRARLAQPMPLGYSSAGVVLEVGRGVEAFRPGDRVASNGPHAGVVAVGQNLVARVPDEVPFDAACYAVVGAVALQGVRLARAELGSVVGVIGLGLVGQLVVALLRASGCAAIGTDPDPSKCALAQRMGAAWAEPSGFAEAIANRTRGFGADAILIAASSRSNGPIEVAARAARAKARVVVVGAVGMDVPRREFYPKELELVVSCSYGPGRYDPSYEEAGHDYPYAHVRWTEQRNIQAVLGLMGERRLDVGLLTTHRYPIERAAEAYAMIRSGAERAVGVLLTYPELTPESRDRRATVPSPRGAGTKRASKDVRGIGLVGAGNFATAVLLPALAAQKGILLRGLCSAGGLTARAQAERHGFAYSCTDAEELFRDPEIDAVFLATRHDTHTELLLKALRAGKHAFVEKPLALDEDELGGIESYLAEVGGGGPFWTVGFNRRFSPAAGAVRDHVRSVHGPLTASYRFSAGDLPPDHWTQDQSLGGGRLVGEACHAADLLTFLIGSPIVRVHAEAVSAGERLRVASDRAAMTFRHADGSVSSLLYTAGGDRACPKERVEIFGGGRAAVLDDFRLVELYAEGRRAVRSWSGQDKGHRQEVAAFLAAARSGGPPPIPIDDLLATTRAMIGAMASLRTGLPVDILGAPDGDDPSLADGRGARP
jgi:predicted dehydrogenase